MNLGSLPPSSSPADLHRLVVVHFDESHLATKLSPPVCWFAINLRPKHLRLAGARSVLYHQDSVRVRPVALAATSRATPVALFSPFLLLSPCLVETHQMYSSNGYRWQREHARCSCADRPPASPGSDTPATLTSSKGRPRRSSFTIPAEIITVTNRK